MGLVEMSTFADTPARHHPGIDEVEACSLDWAFRSAIPFDAYSREKWRSLKAGRFTAHVYPDARFDEVVLYACWNSWWFFLDDYRHMPTDIDRWLAFVHEAEYVIRNGGRTGDDADPLNRALGDLCHQTADLLGAKAYDTLAQGSFDAFHGLTIEAFNNQFGRQPHVTLGEELRIPVHPTQDARSDLHLLAAGVLAGLHHPRSREEHSRMERRRQRRR
ncbi:hypothetical protein ACH4PU_01000 [Streptomyces sp. NPDC021100]|uniref:hypothetical protein n=1 Tax=Streptomyces sp. NPDC021100 TaxID=3365114 RepID=UPI003796358E